ncbi:hypothetical protein I4U23_004047 [Adineta vaga]|nr:hypothetical protein I4U23_004047 [Adineta vaga]
MTTSKTSDFYWACRNGDLDTVKKLLPSLSLNDINRIECNGSTALHAASYYDHENVVRLLLQKGANTNSRNKYDKTAKEEAHTNEIRALFVSTPKAEETSVSDNDDDDIPQSEFIQLYPNNDNMDKSQLATNILKARLRLHQTHKYTISAESNLEHLEKKYRKICEERGEQHSLRLGEEYFQKYREKYDFDHLIQFYTMQSPFYEIIQGDETFLVEMYKHLFRYGKYVFQGPTYRALNLFPKDLEPYRWALMHPNSLLEMRKLAGTHQDKDYPFRYIQKTNDERRLVLFEMQFDKQCFTAIDIDLISQFKEKEVLILSGTFFTVTKIQEDDKGMITISMKNVSVDKNSISTVI